MTAQENLVHCCHEKDKTMTVFANNTEFRSSVLLDNKVQNSTARTFEYSFVCAKKDAISKLIELRTICESHDLMTSCIHRLYDEMCRINVISDPLHELKMQGQLLSLYKRKLFLVTPTELYGFATQLPDQSVAYFGFAIYPQHMVIDGNKVCLHNSEMMHWKGYVKFSAQDYDDYGYTAPEFMYKMMRFARIMKILDDYNVST